MRKSSGKESAVPRDGIVTSMVPRNRRPDRIAVYIEGSFALEVDAGLARSAGLRVGGLLTAETQQSLRDGDQPFLARAKALGLLAIRDRSSEELRTRLRRLGFAPGTIDDVIVWLKDLGYLDDERFARSYALEKMRSGWGDRRVRQELWRKGVDRGSVEGVLAEQQADEESSTGTGGGSAGPGAAPVRLRFPKGSGGDGAAVDGLPGPPGLRLGQYLPDGRTAALGGRGDPVGRAGFLDTFRLGT